MRISTSTFAAVAVAMLATLTPLSAQGQGPGQGSGRAHSGRGFKGLNLTEAQRTQMKAIHDKHQSAIQAKLEVAEAARKAMHAAMADGTSDTASLKALHEKVSAAQFDLMLEHRAIRQEILPLLTPDQKAKFQMQPMGMEGRGHGPRHGGGMGRGWGGQAPMGQDAPPVKPS